MTDAVSTLFSAEADKWEERYRHRFFQDRLDVLDRWLDRHCQQPIHRAIDIGCGTFPMEAVFKRHGLAAIGLDASREMVSVARGLGRDAVHYSGGTIPFDDQSFDCAILINVLEFVADARHLIREIARISRPSSAVLLTFTNFQSPFRRVARRLNRWATRGRNDEPAYIVSKYRYAAIEALLHEAGFVDIRVFRHSLPWAHDKLFWWLPEFVIDVLFRNNLFSDVIYVEATKASA